MNSFIDFFIGFFQYKKRTLYFLDGHPSGGYYLARNGMIGDAYGPMGPGRYRKIKDFYFRYKFQIDDEWRLRTK